MSAASWYRVEPRRHARVRLFCFPHAGGGVSTFADWSEELPEWVELVRVQMPGREGRAGERPFVRMAPLARSAATALAPLLDRPFALFGHSMGALVAFEVARELRRRRRPAPMQLFLSATQAPSCRPIGHAVSDAGVRADLRRLGGTPPELLDHPHLLALYLPTLRADFRVLASYRATPEPPLDTPIAALGGREDDEVPRALLEPWRRETRGRFALHLFPGDHFYIRPRQAEVLATVARILSRAARPASMRRYP